MKKKLETENIEASQLKSIKLTSTKQISCEFDGGGMTWRGEIQKIYLDKNGEAVSYDVYIY